MTPSPQDDPRTLVSTDWLAKHLRDPDLRVLDASWYLPAMNRDAKAEYAAAHIPGARFFDLDSVSDGSCGLPHMLPSPAAFASALSDLGIGETHRVVVYDSVGLFSAARVRWMLKVMGAAHVQVLDGGLPKWKSEGRPVEAGIPPRPLTEHVLSTGATPPHHSQALADPIAA